MTITFWKQVDLQDLTQMGPIQKLLVTSLRQDHVTNLNHHISTTIIVLMATKLGMMVTSLDGLLPMKSHDPLI